MHKSNPIYNTYLNSFFHFSFHFYSTKQMKLFRKQKNQDIIDDDYSESGRTTVVDPFVFPLKTYPQAWFALFLLVLLRTAISVFQFTFSVVPTLTGEIFNVSLSAVNWLANIQGVMYVFMSFFTGWIFQRLGVKKSVQ